jgi:hypothetical protein
LLIGALALVIGQRALKRPEVKIVEEEPQSTDQFTHKCVSEKRQVFRRRGQCVEVDITDHEVKETPWHGWVIDRSIKGLRLGVDRNVEVGTLLNVRVCQMSPPMPWYEVKVVHSKPNAPTYEIGCEFVTPPTWNVLLIFG